MRDRVERRERGVGGKMGEREGREREEREREQAVMGGRRGRMTGRNGKKLGLDSTTISLACHVSLKLLLNPYKRRRCKNKNLISLDFSLITAFIHQNKQIHVKCSTNSFEYVQF